MPGYTLFFVKMHHRVPTIHVHIIFSLKRLRKIGFAFFEEGVHAFLGVLQL